MSLIPSVSVVVIGGGVVGTAILHALAHRGVDALLLERENDLAYAASGTNSGILHTGFDSTPGELETQLILRAARLRAEILPALGVPVLPCGAVLSPRVEGDDAVIADLAANAAANGVATERRGADGALLVPGEAVTDPVAFTLALAASARSAGARIELDAPVVGLDDHGEEMTVRLADGRTVRAAAVINAAGLHADDVARLVGDETFEIYPRKGEFFVFEVPAERRLDSILLPVPTKRTKGVLVFPTLDGRVVTGPTAVDLLDKEDWSVRPEARDEVLAKARAAFAALEGLEPVAQYAGLRPAGRDANYVIGPSGSCARLINVAAIRSTGLSASLGIGAYVAEMLPELGLDVDHARPAAPVASHAVRPEWWRRTAARFAEVGRVTR
ncbi:FAD-dependent oxidoreductase [Microbacterium sp. Kw_RZR3]|uniref:NAD(P)/FAD-dependent oxidoreductase n=1 Tax=Microbacterium sp. Kw_RZR3 TaxID=3032903 RepID=UPI0023DB304C|nr:FAD-dependent oxidoreductase [Microbacterium sp. Kw_RZR3]MDF2048177.1 FAD-dependent oxidoreductase [Microbacterium sp. Kw_RZR3]